MSTVWAACNSFVLGLALLYICLFTLTIPERSLLYFRLIVAPPAILCFWDFGYGSYQPPTLAMSGIMAGIGIYGVMRVLEHSVVGLWDSTPPYWVIRTRKDGPRIAYPASESFRGRCFYAFDLLTSQRGASWSRDRIWNWTPRRLQLWSSAPPKQFVTDGIKAMLIQYLFLDLLDTITKSRSWDTISLYPVSSLSVIEQSIFTMCICGEVFLLISFSFTITSTVCVLCGSSPDTWAPAFDSPFSCTSLSDFWAHRWHWIFRRVFDRLSLPLVRVTTSIVHFSSKEVREKEHIVSVIRTIIIFWLSTLLHLFVMSRVAQPEYRKNYGIDNPPFWDPDILVFFMGQSLGLFIESTVIIRFANWMFPLQKEDLRDRQHQRDTMAHSSSRKEVIGGHKLDEGTGHCWKRVALMRLYTWVFLIWIGRWGADMWVRAGLFHEDETIVPFSLLRGLWGLWFGNR